MKHQVKNVKNLNLALKELAPFVRKGEHLQTGKPFKRFGGMRSREFLANWLLCAATGKGRLTFTSDPLGSDGIIYDKATGETWPTEHVLVPNVDNNKEKNVEALILDAINKKQAKGGASYASGKTLVVFLNSGGGEWVPNRVAQRLPTPLDFEAVWVVGLHGAGSKFTYGVTRLDLSQGNAPTWLIHISDDFSSWKVTPYQ